MKWVFQKPPWGWRLAAGIALLVGSWIPATILPYGVDFLFFVTLIIAVLLAFRWRSMLLLIPLLLNPMSLSFTLGLPEWFGKTPQFYYVGLPGDEFYNLIPETRCYRETDGDKIYGNEWLALSPHNAALHFMVGILGLPRHTYHGPYPSKAEAIQLTEAGIETPRQTFALGKVLANGKEVTIGTNRVQNLLINLNMAYYEELFEIDGSDVSRKVRAAIFQEHCLIMRIGFKDFTDPAKEEMKLPECIVLFDIDNMRPFACYVLSGRDWIRYRPLSN